MPGSGEMGQLPVNVPGVQTSQEAEFQLNVRRRFFPLRIRTEKTWLPPWSGPKLPISGLLSAEAGFVRNWEGGLLALGES